MFGKKKKPQIALMPYDPQKQIPTIRSSICTGEQVAGFQDIGTGKFEEAMFLRGEKDLEEFCTRYVVKREDIKKIW